MSDLKKDLGCLAMAAPLVIAMWLLAATLAYGVVVIIFRYAFGVELWNPFR